VKDEERIISSTLVTYGAKLVTSAIGFLMVPYLLRSLGEGAYGVMGVCWSILGLMLLVEMGVRPAVARQFTNALFRGETERSNEVASTSLAFYGVIASGILLASVVGGGRLLAAMNVSAELHGEGRVALALVGACSGLTLLGVPFMSALFSQLRHDIEQYTAIARSVVGAAAIVALFELSGPGLVKWAVVDLLMTFGVFLAVVWQAHRQCASLRLAPALVTRRGFRDVAGFGSYTSVIAIAAWINTQSGSLVISRFLGTAAVAHFSPVLGIIATLTPLQTAFLAPLRSFLTKAHATGDWGVIRRVLIRSTRYSLLATGSIAVLLAALAFQFVPAWLGPGFEDTSNVLVLCSLGWLFQAGTGASYGIYVGTGRLRMLTAVNVLAALLSLSLGLYLVGWASWGIAGVALGMLAGQAIRSVCFFFHSAGICEVGYAQYLREGYAGPLASLSVLGGVAWGVQHLIDARPFFEVILAGSAAAVAYAPLLWWVGLCPDDRRRALVYLARLRARLPGGGTRQEVGSQR
jgi:O-antigen/teichoic acid export membrane protein